MILVWLIGLAVPLGAPAVAQSRPSLLRQIQSQIIIRQQSILSVPAQRGPPPTTRWREKRGPKCVEMGTVGGAAIVESDSVDLIFRGGQRMRAELSERCPALSFYGGFYIRRPADGRLCAGRDAVHARSGGQCEIKRFRKLEPIVRR